MKKLGKLSINSKKMMKNDELKNLRGGYYPTDEMVCQYCSSGTGNGAICVTSDTIFAYCGLQNYVHDCISFCESQGHVSSFCGAASCF